MHSIRRVKASSEQAAQRRRQDAIKINKFKNLCDRVLSRENINLRDCTDLLHYDPDLYTVYNIRREFINNSNEKEKLLMDELKLTEMLFPKNPKSYNIWNHRRWALEELNKDVIWDVEHKLVEKLLEKDPRNFHGWGYLYYLVDRNSSQKSLEYMFKFTTSKINHNFSNFSAWHYRAKIIPKLESKPDFKHEIEYVYNAVSMDPQDQSAWLYFSWLVNNPGVFNSELSDSSLMEIHNNVWELFEEEKSVPATRFLLKVSKRLNLDVSELLEGLKHLDFRAKYVL